MKLSELFSGLLPAGNICSGELLKDYTTFKTGGPAGVMLFPQNSSQLADILAVCRRTETDFFLLGRGSNLLVSDSGYSGAVISLRRYINNISADSETGIVRAQAGAMLPAVSSAALEAGLGGLEFAAGIPGTIGGGLYMNAGAYGGELKQVVTSAQVLTPQGEFIEVPADSMELGHRTSVFMSSGDIILSCSMQLYERDKELISSDMNEYGRRRREKQPLEYPSAGSTFKRPEGYFAGKLIEDAGLKGYTVGGAQVSEKHAGFVINTGNATAADIYRLVMDVKKTVYERFGVVLEPEIRMLGSFE